MSNVIEKNNEIINEINIMIDELNIKEKEKIILEMIDNMYNEKVCYRSEYNDFMHKIGIAMFNSKNDASNMFSRIHAVNEKVMNSNLAKIIIYKIDALIKTDYSVSGGNIIASKEIYVVNAFYNKMIEHRDDHSIYFKVIEFGTGINGRNIIKEKLSENELYALNVLENYVELYKYIKVFKELINLCECINNS